MGDEPKIRIICTKENPFVPPRKDNEIWEHKDAYDKFPDCESTIVTYHCPNCDMDFDIDFAD